MIFISGIYIFVGDFTLSINGVSTLNAFRALSRDLQGPDVTYLCEVDE